MKNLTFNVNIDVLKIIALVFMTVDHIAKYWFDENSWYALVGIGIGRISFPIFGFLLMRNLFCRKNYAKYIVRLLCFSFVTLGIMLPFVGIVKVAKVFPLNILFSFLVAVLFLRVYDLIEKEDGWVKWEKTAITIIAFWGFGLFSLVCDYGIFGFLFLLFCYFYFKCGSKLNLCGVLISSLLINCDNEFFLVSFLTVVFLLMNNYDVEQKRILKKWWGFYVYYPLHLFVIGVVAYFIK